MLKIAICDDEMHEVKNVKSIIMEAMENQSITYEIKLFGSGEELLESNEQFHCVFLDIVMNGINGIELGMSLYQKDRKVRIIYITNFEEYCSEAVNHVHAFAYLSKPIIKEKLEQQLQALIQLMGEEIKNDIEIELSNVIEICEETKKEYIAIRIPISEIIYFEYMKSDRRVRVKTTNKTFEYVCTMTQLENNMRAYGFAACYRGILVNFAHVLKAKNHIVYLNNGEKLPLSQKRVVEFKEKLNEYVHRSI